MPVEALYDLYKQFPSVQTDTRKLKKGDIFFALKGDNFNGNQFAQTAIDAGAAYAVIDEPAYQINGKTFLVNDVLTALQELAAYHRRQFNIPFMAITGSNGKTTTKELVHAVLSSVYTTYTTEGNLNNHIGIPLTLLKIKSDAEMAVVEMGANHIGEIASYCEYAMPTHGLITNTGKAHLEGFGSIAGVRKAKGELFDYLRSHNGTAFVMWDYDYLQEMSKGIPHIIKYGTGREDTTGRVAASEPFLKVEITLPQAFIIQTQLIGAYNLPNVLAAVATGRHFNIPDEKIKATLENYQPSNSRSQLIEKDSNKIILDAYNANPSSMKLAIENFARIQAKNKVVILGAMAELGADSLEEHKQIINLLQEYKWGQVVLVGGDFLKINHPYLQFENSLAAKEWLRQQHITGAYFLIKGSRSAAMEKVME